MDTVQNKTMPPTWESLSKCAKFKREVEQSNQLLQSMWFEHLIFGKKEDADCIFSKPCCLWMKNSLQICLLCQQKDKIMEKHEWSSFIFLLSRSAEASSSVLEKWNKKLVLTSGILWMNLWIIRAPASGIYLLAIM